MKTTLMVLAACVVLAATPLLADGGEKGDLEVGLYGGYGWPDDYGDTHPKDDVLYGARIGKFLADTLSLELSFQRLKTDTNVDPSLGISNTDANLDGLRLDLLYNFRPGQAIRPFIAEGLGWERFNAASIQDSKEVGFNIGGGLRWFVSDRFGLRLDVRLVSIWVGGDIEERQNNFEETLGAMWAFGKGGSPKRVADSDGDGVADKKDKCPGTPAGARVDEKGCPIDTDGDGVFDGIDRCPDTPPGWRVDELGCPRDTDGDRVPDAKDACPDTPRGARVDERGCPTDSDGDGVFDGLDRCAGTPAGVRVDVSGCPLDSDGDGVDDSRDRCPDTPRGSPVDGNGCPPPPKAAPLFEGEKKALVLEKVHFATNKAVLTADSLPVLDLVAASLKDWPEVRVEVAGHTDTQGSPSYNMKLSEKRAIAVRDYLVSQGVDASRMRVKGYGQTRPIADNKTKEGQAKNRRVELDRLD